MAISLVSASSSELSRSKPLSTDHQNFIRTKITNLNHLLICGNVFIGHSDIPKYLLNHIKKKVIEIANIINDTILGDFPHRQVPAYIATNYFCKVNDHIIFLRLS